MSTRQIRTLSTLSSRGTRPVQEDLLLVLRERGIFAVADGFGGPVAGVDAAKTAVESVRGFLEKEAGDMEATLPFVLRSYFSLAGNVLFNALIHANRKVIALNKDKSVHERGGASVLAGFIDGDLLALANVGSCGAWLFREGLCRELVLPRSYGRLLDPTLIDVADHFQAPLMAAGMSEDLEPEIAEYRLREGDWVLLQTDGVTSAVREQLLSVWKKDAAVGGVDAFREATRLLEAGKYEDNAAAILVGF